MKKEAIKRNLTVRGHEEMLRQVLINIINNAIKYSYPHTRIKITSERANGKGSLLISNCGIPVPEGERALIFNRGHRSDMAKTIVPGGTGLGLWLVRKIIEAHDAEICCELDESLGEKRTVFRITFPNAEYSRPAVSSLE